MAFSRVTPGGAASNGSFSPAYAVGAFSGGSATVTKLSWSEAGTGDLSAAVSNYLGSGLSVSGATSGGAVAFIPHHFDVTLSANGCGSFTYAGLSPAAGQVFQVDVTAMNMANAVTTNYDGSLPSAVSHDVALGEAAALGGTLTTTTPILGTWFRSGVSSGTGQHGSAYYAFATKQTAAQTLVVRANDKTDTVVTSAARLPSPVEASVKLRSGRLRMANAFGSEKSALALQLSTEYWNGSAWIKNPDDACTALAAANLAFSNVRDAKGAAGTWSTTPSFSAFSAGTGTLTLSAPSATGSADLAINLGGGSADQSCLSTHPASTGAALPWLRSRNGAGPDAACSGSPWDRDPSARASFGIYSPETKKTVHVREIF
jgi:MSHA biogenesis protein MshQ